MSSPSLLWALVGLIGQCSATELRLDTLFLFVKEAIDDMDAFLHTSVDHSFHVVRVVVFAEGFAVDGLRC